MRPKGATATGDDGLDTQLRPGFADITVVVGMRRLLEFGSLTVRELEKRLPDVNRRTLQRDMHQLIELGLVFSEGATNKLYYRFRDNVS